MKVSWAELKSITDSKKLPLQFIDQTKYYEVFALDGTVIYSTEIGKAPTAPNGSDQEDFEDNYKASANKKLAPQAKEDKRPLVATNRIPEGYTLYFTGTADDISNGVAGAGDDLLLDGSSLAGGSNKATFQLLNHYYLVGAKCFASGVTIGTHYITARLYAPATTGLTQTTGDYNKSSLGGGMNMIVPVSAGTGSWDLDLTATLPNTQILRAVPVPVAGNTGWFDYDKTNNVITRNMSQTGGYNLYDFDVDLHYFVRKGWLTSGEIQISAEDTVAKQQFNFWKIEFELNTSLLGPSAAILLEVATKDNT